MSTTYITTVEAKEDFADIVNRVAQNKERIVLTRRDKEIAAIISYDDLLLLLEKENKRDLQEATDALKEARAKGTVSLQDLKEELS
jgi:prevent-host-death family protein